MDPVFRATTAWLPFVLSLVAMIMVIGSALSFGVVDHQDEGTPARLFQLLMVVDALVIAWFAISWVPRVPRPATTILVLQVLAASLPVAAVVLLESTAA